ncbi:metallophosphoesterase [Bradyrhizobium sacchari]|uniref:Putative phosphodiesterase n=1 Tax=Bradyrhizobium sacchari TaxID=1399419 RepID=A0A560JSE9_9BRAD|nr:metallophosphoesterase family protein [Bradyrhizobium sacchari]OPZ00102.1 metallophosphoesterase [Bradyrhizobium sacchari]TWB60128.1 putative phosphodiesterase [Bradyrhizobium sacchari]TWB74062.1 putative phosphodiesterase [Bradyrhizobium sacchari]
MKFAAIADVHGNRPALEAVLADIATLGIDEIVNLGDHVSGPLEAARTADLLIERGFPSVRGDQDRILVELWHAGGSARGDFRQLERKHFEWMASMPSTLMYRERAFLCHASPADDAAFWLDRVTADGSVRPSAIDTIEAGAEGIDARIILCGHTHIPRVVRLRDGRLVVNPGSVGLPGYDGKVPVPYVVEVGTPHACYAILEHAGGDWSATIRYVPYDNAAMAALARSKGMPIWASAIATGWAEREVT